MTTDNSNSTQGTKWQWLSLILALLAVAGSIALSLVAGLKPCPLCFYQRTFAMGLLGLFVVGSITRTPPGTLSIGAVPMVIGGFGVSVFHVYLELSKTLDCPAGLFNVGTAPQQSFAMYILMVIAVFGCCFSERVKLKAFITGCVLGTTFAVLSCISNGSLPSTPNPKFDDAGNRVIIGCEPHWDESMTKGRSKN